MKIVIASIIVVSTLFFCEWFYRTFLRPIDSLASETVALADHFNKNGLSGMVYEVWHGYRHTQMLSAAAFEIQGFPLPVSISVYPSMLQASEAAKRNYQYYAISNGNVSIQFPMWGDDTGLIRERVENLFRVFSVKI